MGGLWQRVLADHWWVTFGRESWMIIGDLWQRELADHWWVVFGRESWMIIGGWSLAERAG